MTTKIELKMNPVNQILQAKGLDSNGDVQKYLTHEINRRIGRYMPHLTGVLETKLKHVVSSTRIKIDGPYAGYQYYGVVMVGNPPKIPTGRSLNYTKTFNPKAGPFWDRRLMQDEGKQVLADLQKYIGRKG